MSNHYQNVSKEYFNSPTAVWQLSKSLEIMLNEKVSMLQVGYERIASTIPNDEDFLIEDRFQYHDRKTWGKYNTYMERI